MGNGESQLDINKIPEPTHGTNPIGIPVSDLTIFNIDISNANLEKENQINFNILYDFINSRFKINENENSQVFLINGKNVETDFSKPTDKLLSEIATDEFTNDVSNDLIEAGKDVKLFY